MNQTIPQSSNRSRAVTFVLAFSTIAIFLICGVTLFLIRNTLAGDRREPVAVFEGVTVRTLVELPDDRAYPEAITVGPDGALYVSSYCTGDIYRITPDGELSTYYSGDAIEAASGMTFAPDGTLYVVDGGDCNPRSWTGSIKRVSADGQTVERISNIGENDIPNSLVTDFEGAIYVTDTQHGTIRRLEDDIFSDWWVLPDADAAPTGLAYDATTDTLLVADTNTGKIYRVGFDAERNAANDELLLDQSGRQLDGLTVDHNGRVYITLFDTNRIAIFDQNTGLSILAEDFREPSDIVFLNNTLYVTNFDSVSLAPLVGWLLSPSLPFTVTAIDLPPALQIAPVSIENPPNSEGQAD